MNSRFRQFIEAVRTATNLVEVIGTDVALRPAGSVLKGFSPFHAETQASFVVWPHTQTWHDFSNGGGRGGDVFSYLQERHGLSFREALFEQAARAGVANPYTNGASQSPELEREVERRAIEELFSKAAAYYHRALPERIRQELLHGHYGFSDETIDTLLLGWADGQLQAHFHDLGIAHKLALQTGLFVVMASGRVKDFFHKRVVFPYWKHGRVVYFIARRTEETGDAKWEVAKYKKLLTHSEKHAYVSKTVGNDYFYNEDAAQGADEIIVTEGVTDCISALQAGFACISPATIRFRAKDREKLVALTRRAKKITVCNDAETSGVGAEGALATAEALHAERRDVRIAVLPRSDGAAKIDLNEFLKSHPAEEFRALLEHAPRYVAFLIESIPDDTAKAELEPLLEPIVRALAHASPIEKEASTDKLVERFQIGRRSIQALLREARKEEKGERAKPADDDERLTVLGQIPDAPVSDKHLVPQGWLLHDVDEGDEIAMYKVISNKEGEVSHIPFSHRSVVLSAWVTNYTTGKKMLEVAWKARGKWRRAIVEREKLLDAAKIVDALAGRGFPVHSGNRADIVGYLAAYEDANITFLPVRAVAEQMGWTDSNTDAFLWGDQLIVADANEEEVQFHPADQGEAQLAESLRPAGSLEAWVEGIAILRPYPRVMVGMYASFTPPLLELLGLAGFVFDWSYRTSAGKTVVLRAAASVWGNPDEHSGSGFIRTWKTSLVGFERLASALKNIPVLLDDTKTAAHPALVTDILYQAAAGQGKTRGSVRGSRPTHSWRTILLSTGERKATDFTPDAGSVVRCIALWGCPFGQISDPIALQIRQLEHILFQNYGHAGPRFVRWLLGQDRSALRQRYEGLQEGLWRHLRDTFDAAIASRIASSVAAVELAGELAHEALPMGWEYVSPWTTVLAAATESLRDVDRARQALRHFYDWALTNREQFEYMRKNARPPDQWAGRWQDGELLAVTGIVLRQVLEARGYEFDSIVRQWRERGWMNCQSGRRTQSIRVGGKVDHYYVLNQTALELLAQGDEA